MPYYRVTGEIPRKRHVRFRDQAGNLYAEELMGEEGFVSDSSLLYHVHPPTAIVKSEGLADAAAEPDLLPNHPLLPRHYRTQGLPGGAISVASPEPDPSRPDILSALQEQLGLKLTSSKGPVEVLVIDHVERPSPN